MMVMAVIAGLVEQCESDVTDVDHFSVADFSRNLCHLRQTTKY